MNPTAREQIASLLGGVGAGTFTSRRTAPADGMVGTLVVAWPSSGTGGAIVVERQGEAVTYRATRKPLSFIAFYGDCRHEIRPVRTGYRVVLTYDLAIQG